MLSDIIGSADPQLLLASIQQLAARHPEIVYGFMADTMKAGAATERPSERARGLASASSRKPWGSQGSPTLLQPADIRGRW